eukprot:COSAG01_NODE_6392_length_3696_cov_19.347234_1_plen_98_part_00
MFFPASANTSVPGDVRTDDRIVWDGRVQPARILALVAGDAELHHETGNDAEERRVVVCEGRRVQLSACWLDLRQFSSGWGGGRTESIIHQGEETVRA